MGHKIHIVTARTEAFRVNIEAWLALQGVTVGNGPTDAVSAIWCCAAFAKEPIPDAKSTESGIAGEDALNEKLKGLYGNGKSGLCKLKVSPFTCDNRIR